MEKYRNHNFQELIRCIEEYIRNIEEVYGFYNDTTFGFSLILKHLPDGDWQVFHGKADPSHGKVKLRQMATAKEVRARNAATEIKQKRAFHPLITSIYTMWEHEYRRSISIASGLSGKGDDLVGSDMMGALRHLRNHILHNKGFIPEKEPKLPAIRKMRVFSQLDIGDEIFFNDDSYDVYEIVRGIKIDLDKIVIAATAQDQECRKFGI